MATDMTDARVVCPITTGTPDTETVTPVVAVVYSLHPIMHAFLLLTKSPSFPVSRYILRIRLVAI
jgi:hypothetical protein